MLESKNNLREVYYKIRNILMKKRKKNETMTEKSSYLELIPKSNQEVYYLLFHRV